MSTRQTDEALAKIDVERARRVGQMLASDDMPRHSPVAEQNTLGAILRDPAQWTHVDTLQVREFYRPDHRLIFTAMKALRAAVRAINVTTVQEHLDLGKELDDAGGQTYLLKLAAETPDPGQCGSYVEILKSHALDREMPAIAELLLDASTAPADKVRDALQRLEALKATCDSKSPRRRVSSIEIHDFLALKIPPRAFLLSPILPAQGLTMVYGPRGLGKTQISVGIAVAVAAGDRFLKWSAPKPAGVLLIDGEMPATVMQTRLSAAIEAAGKDPEAPLHLCSPDLNSDIGMPDLSTHEGQEAVDALVRDDTQLIIIDNLSSLMRTGVENDAESWLPLQTWALRHRAAGRSVLFIHHAGKGGAQRGTSRREDVLDCVIALRRPSDYRQSEGARFEVHIEKGRSLYGKDAEPFEARLETDAHGKPTWTTKDLGVDLEAQVTEMIGLGMKAPEIAHELGIGRATAYRYAKRASNGASATGGVNGHE